MSAFQNTSGDYTITLGPTGTNSLTIAGNLTVTGSASFSGNIAGNRIDSGSSNVSVVSSGGNVAIGVGGTSNVFVASTGGANVTGYVSASGNVYGANASFTGTIAGGNLILTGNVAGSLSITGDAYASGFYASNLIITPGLVVTSNIATVTSASYAIGYRDVPQVILSSNVTLGITNSSKHFYSTTAGNLQITIPSAANVSFQTGTQVQIVVQAAGNVIIDTQAGVTLYQAGNATAGTRTVGAYGKATLLKVGTNTWFIDGTGVS